MKPLVFALSAGVLLLAAQTIVRAASIGTPMYTIVSDSTPPTYNLSALGTQDWQVYGASSFSLVPNDRKKDGISIAMSAPVIVSPCSSENTTLRSHQTFTWTDGIPVTTQTADNPEENGFTYSSSSTVAYGVNYETITFTPGDTSVHTIHLYGYNTYNPNLSLQFIASLPGATSVTNTPGTAQGDFDYSIQFQAANPTDALTVVFTFAKTGTTGTKAVCGVQAAAMSGTPPIPVVNWRIIPEDPAYPIRDTIVAGVVIGDTSYFTNSLPTNTATADCSAYFQEAMNFMSVYGGGTVFVPPGHYMFTNNLTLPAAVTLRGRWVRPGSSQPVTGTVFDIYAGQNDTNAPPFLQSGGGGNSLQDLAFWYPNQSATNWQYYPFTVSGGIIEERNLTLVNSYQGIIFPSANFNCLSDIYGTPLTAGMTIVKGPSLPRFYRVNYSPDYWRWSGLPGSPTNAADWTALTTTLLGNTNSIAINAGETSGGNIESCVISGYCYGILNPGGGTISYHNNVVTNCTEALRLESTAGVSAKNCTFASTAGGIAYHHVGGQGASMYGCTLRGGAYAVLDEPNSSPLHTITLNNSTVTGLVSINNNGSLKMIASSFTGGGANIMLNPGVRSVAIMGISNCGPANIVNNTSLNTSDSTVYFVSTKVATAEPDQLFAYPGETHPGWRKPLQPVLFNVPDYGAKGDGVTDDTAAIQAALGAAEANGGGVVFFPAGTYLVTSPLNVTNGVELRGIFGGLQTQKTSGSQLLIDTGAYDTNAPAFITLGDYCGVRGINMQYRNQTWENGVYIPYPYTIQCSGVSNYVWDILVGNCYQGINFKGAHGGVADGCCMGGLVNAYKADGGTTDCLIQFGGIKPGAFWAIDGVNGNDANSFSRTVVDYILADCTNVMLNSIYTHNSHALVSVRGADQLKILDVRGEQMQNGYLFESGSGSIYMQDSGAGMNRNDGTGSYDYWLGPNFSGSVTGLSLGTSSSDDNFLLRVDNPNARFTCYNADFKGSSPLRAIKTAGRVAIVGGSVGGCTVEVPAGGQFLVSQSVIGTMPYVSQAGVMDWSTNCQADAKSSFIAANLNNPTPIAAGITVNTNNLAPITADQGPSIGSTRDTNGDVIVGWHLANGGAGTGTVSNNFNFDVTGQYFANGARTNVTIEVYFLEDTDGSLAVKYDSLTGMKTATNYTLVATNAQWNDYSFTVNDARFAATNGVDIMLVASNCDPVVEFVAVNSTNYLGVPPQLLTSPVAQFTGTPTSGSRPLAVAFTNQSTGSITNLLWTFGDGQTTSTTGVTVSHTYTNAGSYSVSMVASGIGGSSTNTQTGYITVNVPQPPTLTGISQTGGTNLLLTGSGGPTNGLYYYWLRSATNLTLPSTNWSVVSTNQFNADGSFSNSLPIPSDAPQQFYRLQLP